MSVACQSGLSDLTPPCLGSRCWNENALRRGWTDAPSAGPIPRFADRGQAEAFAPEVSGQQRAEARLLVAGQWGAMGLRGDRVPPPCSPSG